MKQTITKEVIKTFENFYTDPYFIEFLSVNAPDYMTASLVIQACKELADKLSN